MFSCLRFRSNMHNYSGKTPLPFRIKSKNFLALKISFFFFSPDFKQAVMAFLEIALLTTDIIAKNFLQK